MKTTRSVEKDLLLAQSGELAPARSQRLDQALSADPALRALRDELETWRRVAGELPAEPRDGAAMRIAARLEIDGQQRVLPMAGYLKPVTALAAGLVLAAGLWIGLQRPAEYATGSVAVAEDGVDLWNDPLDEELAHLETLMLAVSRDALTMVDL